jgi:chromosome segregation ATPase
MATNLTPVQKLAEAEAALKSLASEKATVDVQVAELTSKVADVLAKLDSSEKSLSAKVTELADVQAKLTKAEADKVAAATALDEYKAKFDGEVEKAAQLKAAAAVAAAGIDPVGSKPKDKPADVDPAKPKQTGLCRLADAWGSEIKKLG